MIDSLTKNEKRDLKYFFSPREMEDLANQLANKNQEKRRTEEEKKSVTSDYASKLKLTDEQINSLSDKVASGYEMRDVTCVVSYHEPEKGMKTITRTDTGESFIEGMNDSDHTLWNQWYLKQQEQEEVPILDEEAQAEVDEFEEAELNEEVA